MHVLEKSLLCVMFVLYIDSFFISWFLLVIQNCTVMLIKYVLREKQIAELDVICATCKMLFMNC